MRVGILLVIASLALVSVRPGAAAVFNVTASGVAEIPPNNTTATGSAVFTLDIANSSMTYTVTFSGLSGPLTGTHIHRVSGTGGGAPAIGLNPPLGATEATWSGTLTEPTAATVADLLAGLYYLNIHSTEFPDGEIRGTLVLDPETPVLPTSWGRIKALFR